MEVRLSLKNNSTHLDQVFNIKLFHLCMMHLKSIYNRIRYDLAKEIVVLICSTVLLALFYYIFNDFLNSKIANLSVAMQQKLGQYLSGILFFITVLACGKHLSQLGSQGIADFAAVRGENGQLLKAYRWSVQFFTIFFYHGFAWVIAVSTLYTFKIHTNYILATTMIIVSLFLGNWFKARHASKKHSIKTLPEKRLDLLSSLIHWRKQHLLKRNRLALFCLVLSVILTCLTLLAATSSKPELLGFIICLIAGCVVSSAVYLQLAEDLNFSWAEQSFGVTHNEMMKATDRICLQLALMFGILAGIFLFLSTKIFENSLSWLQLAQLVFVISVPILLTSSLAFQIDARKPAIPILSNILVSLFIATAILAHIASIILIPLAIYYAKSNQLDRFYRA